MACQCEITSIQVLEYLKVFMAMPSIILIISIVVIWKFGETIRKRIKKLKDFEALGIKLAFMQAAVDENILVANEAIGEGAKVKRELANLEPENKKKQEILAKIAEEEKALRNRIKATSSYFHAYSLLSYDKSALEAIVQDPLLINALPSTYWYAKALLNGNSSEHDIMGLLTIANPEIPVATLRKVLDIAVSDRKRQEN